VKHLATFLKDDCGAVTADWVVVTAGVAALGLATALVVTGGVEDLSSEIMVALADIELASAAQQILDTFDFSGGNAAGWSGGRVMDMGGQLGELLVVGPGQTTNFMFEVPEGTQLATMTFDLIGGDSLDYSAQWGFDTATMMINGVPVAIAINNGNQPITLEIPQVDGTTVNAMVTVNSDHLGGRSNWTESTASVTVTVTQPSEDLEFQFTSNANQGIQDEFWGIDNFQTSVTGGPGF
jgi:hypothetical protein